MSVTERVTGGEVTSQGRALCKDGPHTVEVSNVIRETQGLYTDSKIPFRTLGKANESNLRPGSHRPESNTRT